MIMHRFLEQMAHWLEYQSRQKVAFFGKNLTLITLYCLLANIGWLLALQGGNVIIFWPASGFALAMLLLEGLAYLPAIFIAAFLAELLNTDSILIALPIAVGNTLEPLLAHTLLRQFSGFSKHLENTNSFLILSGAALFAALASASIGPSVLYIADKIGSNELLVTMQYWWMADVLGMLFITPIILTISHYPFRLWSLAKTTEAVGLLSLTFIVGQALFYDNGLLGSHFQDELLPGSIIPMAIWAALRFDPRFAGLVNLLIFSMVLCSAHLGIGYFGKHMLTGNISNSWIFGMALSLGVMVIAFKEAERKRLLKNLELTRFAMDHAAVEVYWIKADGHIDYVNQKACNELGYSAQELLQLTIPDLDPNYDSDDWQRHWKTLCNEKIARVETHHRCKDGTIRPIEVSANYIKFDDIEYNVAFAQDISQRKRWEADIKASEQRFRDLFNQSPDPCWLIDHDRFVGCNFAAVRALGYQSIDALLEVRPAQLASYLQVDGQISQPKFYTALVASGEKGLCRFEWTHRHYDGHAIPVEVTLSRIEINGKSLLYCAWRDMTEQRDIIKRLEREQQQLNKTEEIAQLGSWELEAASQKMAWSKQVYKILGLEAKNSAPSYFVFLAHVHPNDRELLDTCYQESIAANRNGYELEHRIIHQASGETRYVLEKAEHIKDAAGRIIRTAGMIQDITSRKRLQLKSERLTHSISASINEIYMFDAATLKLIFANTSAQKQLGYSEDELKNMTALDIKPDFDEQSFQKILNPLRSGEKKSQYYQTRHRAKNGRLYPVEVHLQLFEPQDGPSYFLVIALNISEQRQLEAKLSSIFRAVNAIIWSTDAQLKFEHISQSVLPILGYASDSFNGMDLFGLYETEMFGPDDRSIQSEAVQNMLKTHVPISNLEHRVKDAHGEWRWMTVSMTPIFDDNQNLLNVVGVVTDISAQKQAEAQLLALNIELDQRVQDALTENRQKDLLIQQQSRMVAMGEMIGNIAHQWRQPLNSLAIILMDLEDSFRVGEATVDSVSASVGRCNELLAKMSTTIDDFRNFFKTDKQLVKTVLADVIEEVTSLLSSSLDFHRIELRVDNKAFDVEAWTYPGELSQALLCLINNAKDQIILRRVANGKILLEVGQTPEWASIRVTDNAGGIDPENLAKIFDPYFTTKADGTGLGLYISKLTIEKSMHGQVSAENLSDGACFTVLLPKEIPQT